MKKVIVSLLLLFVLDSCVVVSPRPTGRVGVYSNNRCYPIRTYNNPPFLFPFGYGWFWW
jgi:hypothetical protein